MWGLVWGFIVRSVTSFSPLKFLGGFNILSTGVWAKVLYIALICLGVLICYNKFTAPTYHTQNTVSIAKADNVYNVPQNRPWRGIDIWGLKLGWEGK